MADTAPAPAGDDQSWGDNDPVAPSGPAQLAAIAKEKGPGYAAMVQAVAGGHMDQVKGFGLKAPELQSLMQDAFLVNPNADVADAPARIATRKAFTSGAQAKNIVSIATALEHSANLDDAITKLGNVQSPIPGTTHLVNGIRNSFRDADGNTDVTGFQNTVTPLIDELERAYTQTGGTVSAINDLKQGINLSQSMGQQRAAVQTFIKLLGGKLDEQNKSYNLGMGTVGQTAPGISDRAQQLLSAFSDPDYVKKGLAGVLAAPPGTSGSNGDSSPPDAPTSGATPPPVSPSPTAPPDAPSSPGGASLVSTARDEVTPEGRAWANDLEAAINSGQFKTPEEAYAFTQARGQLSTDSASNSKFMQNLQQVFEYKAKGGRGHIDVLTPVSQPTHPADAAGAALAGFGDSATAGTLNKLGSLVDAGTAKLRGDNRSFGAIYGDALAANNATLDQAEADHPVASLAGRIGGFVAGDAALGAVPGMASLAGRVPSAIRPAIGDALYGAAYGAGASDNLSDVPGAALSGAALGAGGGALGRGVLRGAAALASPAVSAGTRRLVDAGVTLTPGQIAGASGTKLGGWVKAAEDKATSVPLVGDAINMARRSGVEDFNRATGDQVLAPLGQELPKDVPAGHPMVQHLQQAVSDAYDKALTPLRANADQQLGNDYNIIVQGVRPDQRQAFDKALSDVVRPHLPQGNDPITGRQIQMIKRGLNEKIAQYGRDANGSDLAGDLEDLRDSFLQFAERADPKNAAAYRAADAANVKLKRVESAAAGTKDGVFSPQQFRQSVGRRGYGTTTANLATGTAPMQQLATDASTILPSTVPDSGTGARLLMAQAARHAVPAALGGGIGALGDGREGAVTGALTGAALYSRPGLRVAQKVIAGSRGRGFRTLGDMIRSNDALGGAVGTPYLLEQRDFH